MSEIDSVYFDDEIDEPPVVELIIATRKPEKWRFVDLERGKVWKREGEMFVPVDAQVTTTADELSEGSAEISEQSTSTEGEECR